MELSVVIPVYNEEDNIAPLNAVLHEALKDLEHEIVFVDDGSEDSTVQRILDLQNEHAKLVVFARNFGQTSAISAGIGEAAGRYIVTLDGDLQNDPADIPRMLEKLKSEKLDVVVGRRLRRQDGMFLRKIPSKIANWLIRWSTGVHVNDYGCTLKLFRREIAKNLDLYGELHRFIPILSRMHGAKIAEIDVRHHSRRFGSSKYGLGRTLRVLSDLLLMLFFMKYRQKPMHLFGSIGIAMFLLGGLIEFFLLIEKLQGNDIGGRPLFYVGILLLIMSVQFITTGFLSELIMRTYFESQNKKPYAIARRYHGTREVISD
ncbi:MAG: glycosyltransferase family 2 protein [Alphaproteobacteria bacterium]|nr:glycosyltransferase family 2 protein [Alphaproteobacteria bacterium]